VFVSSAARVSSTLNDSAARRRDRRVESTDADLRRRGGAIRQDLVSRALHAASFHGVRLLARPRPRPARSATPRRRYMLEHEVVGANFVYAARRLPDNGLSRGRW